MAYKTIKRASVPILKSFGPMKTELRGKEVREFSYYVIWENELGAGLGAFSCPSSWLLQYKCMGTFKRWTAVTLHLLVYRLETCRDL